MTVRDLHGSHQPKAKLEAYNDNRGPLISRAKVFGYER